MAFILIEQLTKPHVGLVTNCRVAVWICQNGTGNLLNRSEIVEKLLGLVKVYTGAGRIGQKL